MVADGNQDYQIDQQQNLLRYPDRKMLKLNIDAGGVRSRMMIDRAIVAEMATNEAA